MYNPDTKVWTAQLDMMVPRSNHSLAVVQGRLVVFGGYQGTETTSKEEVLRCPQVGLPCPALGPSLLDREELLAQT